MKSPTTNPIQSWFTRTVMPGLLATIILSFGAATTARADDKESHGNAGVFPPHSKAFGKSYGEWATAWVQWALSIPADRNPLTDSTGAFAGESQHGPVWFAPGTLGGSAERSYTVPAGKAIFVPVYTWIFGAAVYDCEPTVPGVPCVVCDLQDLAATNTETAEDLDVSLDGVSLKHLRRYRASSPGPFSIVYPENSLLGEPAGTYFPEVTDGYWLLLAPLAKGPHEIRIHVRAPNTSYGLIEFDVLHHITVTRPSHDRDEDGGRGKD